MPDEYFIRKSDVEKLIAKRIKTLKDNQKRGSGYTSAMVNLGALRLELDDLYTVKVAFKEEPTIFRTRGKNEQRN